jgi:hypothetical protein
MGDRLRFTTTLSCLISSKRIMVVVLAAVLAWLPTPSGIVERVYSTWGYAALQRVLTALSNRVPFALFDVLIFVVVGGWVALAVRDGTRRGPETRGSLLRAAGRISARTIVWAAGLYLMFLLVWGLNYRRTTLEEKLSFDDRAVTRGAARTLALMAAERLNGLHAAAHAAGWPAPGAIDPSLAEALARADRAIGGRGTMTPGRPKATILDWYFRRTATEGMTDPFFLETLISTSLLPFERPFVVAHEWSHLAGIAQEGEANFLAWLACVNASPPAQYSGWLFLYSELVAALDEPGRAEVRSSLETGPRADLAAIRERVQREIDPRLAAAGRRVYDRYLKANRVEEGVESYGQVVKLVLGVRFRAGWVPQLR